VLSLRIPPKKGRARTAYPFPAKRRPRQQPVRE
jgi:hypothetical protein